MYAQNGLNVCNIVPSFLRVYRQTIAIFLMLALGILNGQGGTPSPVVDPGRQAVWDAAQVQANSRIDSFDAALRSGNPEIIRKAALELQSDPIAVQKVNQNRPDLVSAHNKITAEIKVQARKNIQENLANEWNTANPQNTIKPEDVSVYEATNYRDPGAKEKIGQDWDVTPQVRGKELPPSMSRTAEGVVNKSYFDAAGGEKTFGNGVTADQAAHRQAVETMHGNKSPDAYNEPEKIIGKAATQSSPGTPPDPRVDLRDPRQLTHAMGNKSIEPLNRAADARNAGNDIGAVKNDFEALRQAQKQFDGITKPRVAARGGQISPHVEDGMNIIRRASLGEISPEQARAELAGIGETPESMINKAAGQAEAAQVLKPPKSPTASGPGPAGKPAALDQAPGPKPATGGDSVAGPVERVKPLKPTSRPTAVVDAPVKANLETVQAPVSKPGSSPVRAPVTPSPAAAEEPVIIRKPLAGRVDKVVGGMAVTGPMVESFAGAAGRAADSNRSMNAHDVGEALLDGSGIKPAYELGHTISSEEVQKMRLGQQGRAETLGRTGVRMTDAVARSMINDPVDRNIKEEEARARRAGEEPNYLRSTAMGAAEVAGNFTGIGALARGAAEYSTLDERRMLAAQREKMAGYVETNTAASTARIRGLQKEIEQLSLGNVKDPAIIAQLNDKMQAYNTEQQRLQNLSRMAETQLGDVNPDKAMLPGKALQTLPRQADFDEYIRQNVADRGGSLPVKANIPNRVNAPDQSATFDPAAAARGLMSSSFGDLVTAAGSAINDAGNKIKDRVETELITGGVDALRNGQGQSIARGAVAGLSAEDPELRRVRQLYNNAPEGSEERNRLNNLFVQLRDGKDKYQAQQELARRWAASPLSARAAAEAANALPSKADMVNSLAESDNNLRGHNEYINKLKERNASPEDIASAEWIRDQEQNRRNQLHESIERGEFREAQVAALANNNPAGTAAAQTAPPVVTGAQIPQDLADMVQTAVQEDAATGLQGANGTEAPAKPKPQWSVDQLQNDNFNMGSLADRTRNQIDKLEREIERSRNSAERDLLQNQLLEKQKELQQINERVSENNRLLGEQGVPPGDGSAGGNGRRPKWTADQLQNDNWGMGNLAARQQAEIDKLNRRIAESHNSAERAELERQLREKEKELGRTNDRIRDNNSLLSAQGAPPGDGTKEKEKLPNWDPELLQNDNWNMGNLAERQRAEIDKINRQIAESHNSAERRRLQEQLRQRQAELNQTGERIKDNNSLLSAQGTPPGDGTKEREKLPNWDPELLQNDNWNMGNLAERQRAGIDKIKGQIAASHNSAERRQLQEQLRQKQKELDQIGARINENNELLNQQGGAGANTGDLAAMEGDGGGEGTLPGPNQPEWFEGMIGGLQRQTSGSDPYSLMDNGTRLNQSSTSGDGNLNQASALVDSAGRSAQNTRNRSASDTASADAANSVGQTIGNAVVDGFVAGGTAFGNSVGAGAGGRATGGMFGGGRNRNSADHAGSSTGNSGNSGGSGSRGASSQSTGGTGVQSGTGGQTRPTPSGGGKSRGGSSSGTRGVNSSSQQGATNPVNTTSGTAGGAAKCRIWAGYYGYDVIDLRRVGGDCTVKGISWSDYLSKPYDTPPTKCPQCGGPARYDARSK